MDYTIDNLPKGKTLLTQIRKVGGGKYQVEIAEIVSNPTAGTNLAQLANEGDERFNRTQKPRRAWLTGTAEGIKKLFGIDVTTLEFAEVKRAKGDTIEAAVLNKVDPKIYGTGARYHVEIHDSFRPSFVGQGPKQTGTGMVFVKGGRPIYSNTRMVAGNPVHSIIQSDERVPMEELTNIPSEVASGLPLND